MCESENTESPIQMTLKHRRNERKEKILFFFLLHRKKKNERTEIKNEKRKQMDN